MVKLKVCIKIEFSDYGYKTYGKNYVVETMAGRLIQTNEVKFLEILKIEKINENENKKKNDEK